MTLADFLFRKQRDTGEEEAFAEFEQVLSRSPNQPYTDYARIRYALDLADAHKGDRALEVIEPVLTDPAWSGRAYFVRGEAHAKLGRTEEALADLRKASQTADSVSIRGDALADLAALYENRNRPDLAVEALRACIDVQPWRADRTYLEVKLARNILATGDYARAAGMALALEMVALNDPQHYAKPGQLDQLVKGCDEILDACEKGAPEEATPPAP